MSLTLHLKLDDASGTTATATVGSNGTYARDASNTYNATGGPGTAIVKWQNFAAGSSDKVTISGVSFATTVPFSVLCWMKPSSFASTFHLIGTAGNFTSRISVVNSTTIRVLNGGGSNLDFTVTAMSTSAWTCVLLTKDASNNVRLFTNGTQSSTGAIAGGTGTFAPNSIGVASTVFYSGGVAWLKVFNSDESANAAALFAEANLSGARRRRLLVSGGI